ncbi:zinc-ribbon domain-containing protein [Niallia taxi]|uniref:zinc-ribbon domain-containing protein n=1 Tax=Niallia taxi TaxID=2499688 RepID=UPI0030094377
MAILEKEIEVGLNHMNIKYYEEKGYKINRFPNKQGKLTIPRNANKLLVKIEDLQKNSNIKVSRICDDCGKLENNIVFHTIVKVREKENGIDRCFQCTRIKAGKTRRKGVSNENTLEYYALNNHKENLIREYSIDNNLKINEVSRGTNFLCNWNCETCNSTYQMSPSNRTGKKQAGCPYCSGHKVNDTNCLWTSHPAIAVKLLDKKLGYKVSYGSQTKTTFVCDNCNETFDKQINVATKNGLNCPHCSDGVSYPEKFMLSLLKQIDCKYVYQKGNFAWVENRIYDFYIPKLSCIIEVHGSQHYIEKGFDKLGGRNLKEEQDNDRLKERLAKSNGIENYIVIDCRESDKEWIKSSILISDLSKLLDLKDGRVDWEKCHEQACKSLVKRACYLWNSGVKVKQISNQLEVSNTAIRKYLKQGNLLGICDYRPVNRKNIVQLSLCGKYLINEWDSIAEAADHIGISATNISAVCRSITETSHGFRWMYTNDYEKIKGEDIVSYFASRHKKQSKEILQLTLDGNVIKEWQSAGEVSRSLNISKTAILNVCKRKKHYKTSAGYKWVFKEDYERYIEEQFNKAI